MFDRGYFIEGTLPIAQSRLNFLIVKERQSPAKILERSQIAAKVLETSGSGPHPSPRGKFEVNLRVMFQFNNIKGLLGGAASLPFPRFKRAQQACFTSKRPRFTQLHPCFTPASLLLHLAFRRPVWGRFPCRSYVFEGPTDLSLRFHFDFTCDIGDQRSPEPCNYLSISLSEF